MDYGLGNWIRRRSQLDGRDIAISTKDEAISYHRLDLLTDRLANSLASAGVRFGDRVALLLENSEEWIEILFAAAKLGAVVVPIDPSLTPDEVSFILTDSGPRVAFTSDAHSEILQKAMKETSMELDLVVESRSESSSFARYNDFASDGATDFPRQQISGSELLIISYTTGPTLRPKGVVLTHSNVISHTVSMVTSQISLTKKDETIAIEPFTNLFGLTTLALPLLYIGGTLHIDRDLETSDYIDAINRTDPSVLSLSFREWHSLAEHLDRETLSPQSLRYALCTEGLISRDDYQKLEAQGVRVANTYGLTELCGVSTIDEPTAGISETTRRGQPLFDVDVRIENSTGTVLADEESGEIVFEGPSVFRGYWGLPMETSQVLKQSNLHSGDIGYLDKEGYLYVKSSNHISPPANIHVSFKEIETALATQNEISEMAVVGIDGANRDAAILVAVVLKPQSDITVAELTYKLKKLWNSASHNIKVMVLDKLPRSASGKVLKSELEAIYLEHNGYR